MAALRRASVTATVTCHLRSKRVKRGSFIVLVQDANDELDADFQAVFGMEEPHRRRSSLRIVGGYGKLDRYLEEHG